MKSSGTNNIEVRVFSVGENTGITGFCCADHAVRFFERQYPLAEGMTYNSYVIDDEKLTVVDTVDASVEKTWRESLDRFLRGKRSPDYLIVQHLEPDHSAAIGNFMKDFPECRLVCTAKAAQMLPQFAAGISPERIVAVREDDTLDTGCRQLTFLMAPMVHWPEVMVTYDPMSSTLFSADAFGTFGTALALQGASGELSGATLVSDWRGEARRYYANICGKYGAQVQALLKKVSALDIARLCPLHGPVINLSEFNPVPLYDRWSTWEPEDNGCVIFVSSLHGGTLAAAYELETMLAAQGVETRVFDMMGADLAEAVSQAFANKGLVFMSPTYDGAMMPAMRGLLSRLQSKGLRGRVVGVVENGSWAPVAGRLMTEELQRMKDMEIVEPKVTVRTRLTDESRQALEALAENLAGRL